MGNPGNQRDNEPVHYRVELLFQSKNVCGIWPVSYTHLDVYKRQRHDFWQGYGGTLTETSVPKGAIPVSYTHLQTAKLLYALLLDRSTLSQKNGWQDGEGRIFIVYPVDVYKRQRLDKVRYMFQKIM